MLSFAVELTMPRGVARNDYGNITISKLIGRNINNKVAALKPSM